MYDLITIGSATLDIVVKSQHFQIRQVEGDTVMCEGYGDKMDVEELKFVSGGGATNVAVGCSRLGLRTASICEIGKDMAASVILSDLENEKVETKYIIKERLEETAVSILLASGEGGRSALTHRGAAYELESRDIPWHDLANTRWLHLGTLGGNKELIFDLFEFAKHHQLNVSWTPALKDLALFTSNQLAMYAMYCTVMIMNSTEWDTLGEKQKAFLKEIEHTIITDGKSGGTIFQNGKELLRYESQKVRTVEETGAGDAFASGFIAGQLMNKTVAESVEWGKKNSASVVQFLGAKEGLLTKEKIEIFNS